jgi:hypothetical protein
MISLPVQIADALSGDLKDQYLQQVAAVRQFTSGLDESVVVPSLRHAMAQLFIQSYGLPEAEAEAAARLACELPPRSERQGRVAASVERCALQRALVVAGLVPGVAPYFRAAARGAQEGFSLDASLVLTARPGEVARPTIPTLPPIHHQTRDVASAASSRFFQDKAF